MTNHDAGADRLMDGPAASSALRSALALTCGLLAGFGGQTAHASGDGIGGPRLRVAGPPELVVAAEAMNCGSRREIDVTDIPPAAFRRNDGVVVFLAGNSTNIPFVGPTLESASRASCDRLLRSAANPDPAQYRDKEWIMALHSADGRHVVGLVHNEHHGEQHGDSPCDVSSVADRECWYASVTMVVSTDGGRTYTRPSAPENVALALPWPYRSGRRREGVFMPKVVGDPRSGNAYVLASRVDRNRNLRVAQCLLKSDASFPPRWRVWNGRDFVQTGPGPYACRGACPDTAEPCAPVLAGAIFSVKYLPAHDRFVALGVSGTTVYYRYSPDLVTWGPARDLATVSAFGRWQPGEPPPEWYFSLLDPGSVSRNFDTLEARPYLYFVRFRLNPDGTRVDNRRRDVMRIPLSMDAQ